MKSIGGLCFDIIGATDLLKSVDVVSQCRPVNVFGSAVVKVDGPRHEVCRESR